MSAIEISLSFMARWQIEIMSTLLMGGLLFRWFAYKASKHDQLYFSAFTRELELYLDKQKETHDKIEDTESYITTLMNGIQQKLPARNFREKKKMASDTQRLKPGGQNLSIKDYLNNKQGLSYSILEEINIFQCKTPPNFQELTKRIMNRDKNWSNLMGVIPIESVSRMIDILPGLFIVLGVFGTFIGVSMALPEIAKIDFQNIESSGVLLNSFVKNISFSMNTSIAGIFFSVVLTLLNTLYPIKGRRDAIMKQVETSLELLWYHIHNEISKEKGLNEILDRLTIAIESFVKLNSSPHQEVKKDVA